MPLVGYQPESRAVHLGGGNSFRVRGLSLNDVAVLVREHLPDLDALFELFNGVEQIPAEHIRAMVISVASQAPGFVANVIALASGETDATESAANLPAPVAVQALLDIGELTFTEVGGVGKGLGMVARLLNKTEMTNKITTAMKRSSTTAVQSASTSAFDAM